MWTSMVKLLSNAVNRISIIYDFLINNFSCSIANINGIHYLLLSVRYPQMV